MLGYPAEQSRTEANNTDDRDLSDDERIDRLLQCVEARDLMSYGMIPEFVGRFPVIVSLNHLDVNSLVNILSQPKNALVPQFKSLFKMDKVNTRSDMHVIRSLQSSRIACMSQVDLQFSSEALYAVAERAKEQKTGARGLRSIVVQILV